MEREVLVRHGTNRGGIGLAVVEKKLIWSRKQAFKTQELKRLDQTQLVPQFSKILLQPCNILLAPVK